MPLKEGPAGVLCAQAREGKALEGSVAEYIQNVYLFGSSGSIWIRRYLRIWKGHGYCIHLRPR